LTRSLTLGGGIEYLSSVKSGPAMPYTNFSLRITNNLLLSGEYTYGVRAKGTLTYRLPSNMQLDLNYTWYNKDQKAIMYNYREERRAVLSVPLRIGKIPTYQRLSVYQIVLPTTKYTTGEWLLSGSIFGVNTNLTTYGLFLAKNAPYIYSNLSISYRLPGGFVFMPQAQYSYSKKELISAKVAVEKHLLEHAFLNLSYEKQFSSNLNMAEFGFRYDFSFAQTGASVRQSNNKTTLVQYARGSLINDRKTKYLGADNRNNVGKGGITIMPFLDLNSNGRKDKGEPKAYGLNLKANGGRVEKSDRDSTIRILGLEPYTTCYIELDPNSFDNIAWRLQKPTLNVEVDPNILKQIEIPISVVGEATGTVKIEKEGEKTGLGRIIVSFFYANMKPAGKTLTENDGYFSYFGLIPGRYSVMIDTGQLKTLNMISEPTIQSFVVKAGTEGDIINGLDFVVRTKPDTTKIKTPATEKPVVRKDTSILMIHEVTRELVTIAEDSYAIQLGAFKNKSFADAMRRKLQSQISKKVDIIMEDGFYKVRIGDLKDRKEVDDIIAILKKNGVNELWVISLKAKKQQWVVTERKDTVRTITESAEPAFGPDITIQLGAFRDQSNALALLKSLKARYGNRLKMVFDGNFYKIRLTGSPVLKQTVLDEMNKLGPSLGKLKFKDFWVVPPELATENLPEVREPEPPINPVEWNRKVPAIMKPGLPVGIFQNKIIGSSMPSKPTVYLQVAVYHKKAEALRAMRKIRSKLNLQVEIIEQWDYYHVVIKGFYTREETYKYYPELAGLGFPGVTLFEKK
jgi:cell division septation protein DedD